MMIVCVVLTIFGVGFIRWLLFARRHGPRGIPSGLSVRQFALRRRRPSTCLVALDLGASPSQKNHNATSMA